MGPGAALLDRIILIAGGIEMAMGALLAAFPNLVPPWLAWACFAVGLATIAFGAYRIRLDVWDWLLEKARERDANKNLASPVVPDWPVRDLFFHIDPNVLDIRPDDEAPWQTVGNSIRDAFALGQLKVWVASRSMG
jgi:hypothetical protein